MPSQATAARAGDPPVGQFDCGRSWRKSAPADGRYGAAKWTAYTTSDAAQNPPQRLTSFPSTSTHIWFYGMTITLLGHLPVADACWDFDPPDLATSGFYASGADGWVGYLFEIYGGNWARGY